MSFFDEAYEGMPPWDIGRPQSVFVQLLETGRLRHNPILDVGCGTGENALFFAAKGFEVVGVDAAPRAIETARQKAKDRGLRATFLLHDALDLAALNRTFASVTDCGLFHTFDDGDRVRFADQVWRVLKPGGTYHMMCFSDREPGDWGGPRRVSRREIREAFRPPRFHVRSIEDSRFETRFHDGGGRAYLATVERS